MRRSFSDDLARCAEQAALSAQVTHFHSEGVAGAFAVAVAAAVATHCRLAGANNAAEQIRDAVLNFTSAGETLDMLNKAFTFSFDTRPELVASVVGNGFRGTAPDTVPLCIWNACRCIEDYEEAFLSTVEVGGDCDTNCAIVGGIVASYTGRSGIPSQWLEQRERQRPTYGNAFLRVFSRCSELLQADAVSLFISNRPFQSCLSGFSARQCT